MHLTSQSHCKQGSWEGCFPLPFPSPGPSSHKAPVWGVLGAALLVLACSPSATLATGTLLWPSQEKQLMPINIQGYTTWSHIPTQPGKRQFIMSSALSQQGFPAGLCAPISTCSHRLQQVPFPCRHPNPTRSSAGACRLSQADPHTQGHVPGLVGRFQGTPGPVEAAVPQCQSCPAAWLHACHMLPIPAPSLGGTHVTGVPCLGRGG